MIDAEQARTRLQERRAAVNARLLRIETRLDAAHSTDWSDAAIEHEDDEALESLGRAGLDEIQAIDAALARLSSGGYGLCVRCGGEISEMRLFVLPQTPFCRNCAG